MRYTYGGIQWQFKKRNRESKGCRRIYILVSDWIFSNTKIYESMYFARSVKYMSSVDIIVSQIELVFIQEQLLKLFLLFFSR